MTRSKDFHSDLTLCRLVESALCQWAMWVHSLFGCCIGLYHSALCYCMFYLCSSSVESAGENGFIIVQIPRQLNTQRTILIDRTHAVIVLHHCMLDSNDHDLFLWIKRCFDQPLCQLFMDRREVRGDFSQQHGVQLCQKSKILLSSFFLLFPPTSQKNNRIPSTLILKYSLTLQPNYSLMGHKRQDKSVWDWTFSEFEQLTVHTLFCMWNKFFIYFFFAFYFHCCFVLFKLTWNLDQTKGVGKDNPAESVMSWHMVGDQRHSKTH